jgi:hypothetical protein
LPITRFTATIPMVKAMKPYKSKRTVSVDCTLLSGVPLISMKLTTDTRIDSQKIQRHPTADATRPPKSAEAPEPPHEPIDQ